MKQIIIVLFLLCNGCGYTISHKQQIPRDIARTPRGLTEKLEAISPGMRKEHAWAILGAKHDTNNLFEALTGEEKRCILYGCFSIGNDKEIKNARIFFLLFKDLPITIDAIKPWKMSWVLATKGSDATVYFIFDQYLILQKIIGPDKLYVAQKREDTIFSVADDIVGGTAGQAGKRLGKIP